MRDQPELLTAISPETGAPLGWSYISPLGLWHLLSLDAPSVATLWTYFIARCCGLHLPATELAAMFAAVWTIYAADRLLDARPLRRQDAFSHASLELRHRFHDQYRPAFTVALTLAITALIILVAHMPRKTIDWFSILSAVFAAWILAVHSRPQPPAGAGPLARRPLPKEVAVGLFFSAAVFLPAMIAEPALRLPLSLMAVAFAALCSANCLYLYRWEHDGDASGAHWTTRRLLPHLHTLALGTVALAAACALLTTGTHAAGIWMLVAGALALSALALVVLDRYRLRFNSLHLRALCDLVLMTPLLFLLFLPKAAA